MIVKPEIPSAVPAPARLPAPHGLPEIAATFGNIENYVLTNGELDPRWQAEYFGEAALPCPIMLSFDHSRYVSHFTCHKLLVDIFENVFSEIQRRGFQSGVTSFGGCFSFRPQRTGVKLSTHSWGIAIDLNSETNMQGTSGNMSADIVAIFQAASFEWGGNWPGKIKDPMHFQFCTGY